MELILKINGSKTPKAEYIGWTPVKCTLSINNYDHDTPIPVVIKTSHSNGKGRIALYKNNSTSSNPVEEIRHSFEGNTELEFYVAGKYPYASVEIKDTSVLVSSEVDELDNLKKKLMVRVRKNAEDLKPKEIEKFLAAFVKLNNLPPRKTYLGTGFSAKPSKLLHEIILMHTYDAAREIHGRTSFHPWHRAFLSHLERELQEVDPTVTVPYWRYDQAAPKVFSNIFIGVTAKSSNSTGPARPTFKNGNPLYSYQTVWGPLLRGYNYLNPASKKPWARIANQSVLLSDILVENVYDVPNDNVRSTKFKGWAFLEERRSHNLAHGVFSGLVADIGKDPVDPLFFLLHSNVDRLWALWQRKYNRIDRTKNETYPYQGAYGGHRSGPFRFPGNEDIGNYALDTLWPWDLDHLPTRPERKWNFRAPVGRGKVPQIQLKFPNSQNSQAPGVSPTVESTIDYQGRLNGDSWGFDYDHIPFFDHDIVYFENESMENIDDYNAVFFDSTKSIQERLQASEKAFMRNRDEFDKVLHILQNADEDIRIRLEALGHTDEGEERFLDVAIELANSESVSAELKYQLIHTVYSSKRSNKHYPSRQPAFFNVLRGLMTGENEKLRSQAIEILSANQDDIVQDFLVAELQKQEGTLLAKDDAIAFLNQTLKPEFSELFKTVFEDSDNLQVKSAALRALANDPASAEFLKNIVKDKRANFKLREASALSLHHLDPEVMNNLAAEIISESEIGPGIKMFRSKNPSPDEVDFKSGLLNMLTFTAKLDKFNKNLELIESLEELTDESPIEKANFIGTFEAITKSEMDKSGPTAIEELAKKLLTKLKSNDEEE